MFKNKRFGARAVAILFITFFMFAFQSLLTTGQLNVIQPYLITVNGWTENAIAVPTTIASYLMIPGYLLVGWLLLKYGVLKVTVPCSVLCAIGSLLIAFSQGGYGMFCVGVALVYLTICPLMMGAQKLLSEWFIRYRGRAMGIATMGPPFLAAFTMTPLANLVNGKGLKAAYVLIACVLLAIAVYLVIFVRDRPQLVALYPDGADNPPESEPEGGQERISPKELLKQKNAWKIIFSYGFLNFIIYSCTAYMILRFISIGGTQADGLKAFGIGSILGIPMSYVFGAIDDKLGSIKASIALILAYLVGLVPLALMTGPSWAAIIAAAFGIACMTGGLPTMDPAIVSYVWGHTKFQSVKTVLQPIMSLIGASAVAYMAMFSTAGHMTWAFYGLIIMDLIALVIMFTMLKVPDADEADRDYGEAANAKMHQKMN